MHDIVVEGDKIVYNMQIFIIIFPKPDIIVILLDIGDGKEKLFFTVEMMIEGAAGGA